MITTKMAFGGIDGLTSGAKAIAVIQVLLQCWDVEAWETFHGLPFPYSGSEGVALCQSPRTSQHAVAE